MNFRRLMPGYAHGVIRQNLFEIQKTIEEIKNKMPSIDDVKAAVDAAVAQAKDAINAAVVKEVGEVKAQIQALKDQIAAGGTISQADLDAIVSSVSGIAPAATTAVDSISTSDGADVAITPPTP